MSLAVPKGLTVCAADRPGETVWDGFFNNPIKGRPLDSQTSQLALRAIDALQAYDFDRRRAVDDLMRNGAFLLKRSRGVELWVGLPRVSLEVQQRWTGLRLSAWPTATTARRRVAVLSSRLGVEPARHEHWFGALRTLCCRLPSESVLLTYQGTTADRFVRRAAKLFGLECFRVRLGDVNEAFAEASEEFVVLGAPILPESVDGPLAETALGDRVLAAVADQVRVLHVQRSRNIAVILRARLMDRFPPGSTWFCPGGTSRSFARELSENGAVPWLLNSDPTSAGDPPGAPVTAPLDRPPFDDYLVHWTRPPAGPWPDESEEAYLDRLILGTDCSNRTAFAALCRIVRSGRLIASGHLIRDATPVVCFTQVPLSEFADRRVFRPHLHRWDFEPYGVAIRRNRLEDLGVRRVIYGSEADYQSLDSAERPFFQKADSGDDWRAEQEWRHPGTLELTSFEAQDAFVFVPTADEAAVVSRLSAWPVVVVPGHDATSDGGTD